jgi:uncharacterized protein
MNLERADGFFTALICGPGRVLFEDYVPVVFGVNSYDRHAFARLKTATTIRQLLNRHWSAISDTLTQGGCHVPLLLGNIEDEGCGRNWGQGFMLGVGLRTADWAMLQESDHYGDWVLPIYAMASEEQLAARAEPMTSAKRKDLIELASVATAKLYEYWRLH